MIRALAKTNIRETLRNMATAEANIIKSTAEPGPIEESIIEKITTALAPSYLKVSNDSHKHSHHKPMQSASNVQESHFRLEIVSDKFEGKNMPSRHRLIYQLLDDEFKTKGLHALQMKTKTVAEQEKSKK